MKDDAAFFLFFLFLFFLDTLLFFACIFLDFYSYVHVYRFIHIKCLICLFVSFSLHSLCFRSGNLETSAHCEVQFLGGRFLLGSFLAIAF